MPSIVVATPTVKNNSGSGSVTTAAFTPTTLGSTLIAIGCTRQSGSDPTALLASDSLTGTWTALAQILTGTAGRNRLAVHCQLVTALSSRTVTMACTNGVRNILSVLECIGFTGTPSNVATGSNNSGDPSCTLSPAPYSDNWVLGAGSFNGADNPVTPTGFTDVEAFALQTDLYQNIFYDDTSPAATASYSSANNQSNIVTMELVPVRGIYSFGQWN